MSVYLAERESNSARRQQIGTCVPRKVFERVELFRDFWHCGSKDGIVLLVIIISGKPDAISSDSRLTRAMQMDWRHNPIKIGTSFKIDG